MLITILDYDYLLHFIIAFNVNIILRVDTYRTLKNLFKIYKKKDGSPLLCMKLEFLYVVN